MSGCCFCVGIVVSVCHRMQRLKEQLSGSDDNSPCATKKMNAELGVLVLLCQNLNMCSYLTKP